MQDRLKFRAWDNGNMIMHYDFQYIKSGDEGNDWIIFQSDKQKLKFDDENKYNVNVYPNPYFSQQLDIMQCTGMKDTNDRLVYEGDIVKVKVEYENVWECDEYGGKIITHIYMGKIIFEECAFKIDVTDTTRHPLSLSYHNNDLEVIGNIYENPELLESEAEGEE